MKCLVFSSYINAYTIYKGVQRLGGTVYTTDLDSPFPIPKNKKIEKADWLFFTEEASLRRALSNKLEGNYLPKKFPLNLLDNKWEFVSWLNSNNLAEAPKQWVLKESDQVAYPCFLKAKHSWVDSKKLPRGWLCNSSKEIKDRIAYLKSVELDTNFFFLQEWINDSQSLVISVCGFHDAQKNYRNLTAVVKHIKINSDVLIGSAIAVETINDKWNLTEKSISILNKLDFTGPFEMEFIVMDNKVLFLELNPRFWLQHAIFLNNGNGLIKRYLCLDNQQEHLINKIDNVIWIDSINLIVSIIKLKTNFLTFVITKLFIKQKRFIIFPSLPIALYVVLKMCWRKLKIKLFNLTYSK
jgi:hypothetical protein